MYEYPREIHRIKIEKPDFQEMAGKAMGHTVPVTPISGLSRFQFMQVLDSFHTILAGEMERVYIMAWKEAVRVVQTGELSATKED